MLGVGLKVEVVQLLRQSNIRREKPIWCRWNMFDKNFSYELCWALMVVAHGSTEKLRIDSVSVTN